MKTSCKLSILLSSINSNFINTTQKLEPFSIQAYSYQNCDWSFNTNQLKAFYWGAELWKEDSKHWLGCAHRVWRMEVLFKSHLLDTTIYQTKYRSLWLAISDQNTLQWHCLSTFFKSVASILHTLWVYSIRTLCIFIPKRS